MATLSWSDLNVTTKDNVAIVSKSNGLCPAGHIIALMGPSGSGKTTLLNSLASRDMGSAIKVHGDVEYLYQGQESPQKLSAVSTYVEQEDHLIGCLTVKDTLWYTGELSGLSGAILKDQVEYLLNAFGLKGQSDILVGTPIQKGISGGQKRRLTVASQLMRNPKVIFMDEPTSGLDSKASFEIISHMKNYAHEHGAIVIVSIHQPSTSTFDLFDEVVFLSKGRTVYNGPVKEVVEYFKNIDMEIPQYYNPAEYILEAISTDFGSGDNTNDISDLVSKWEDYNNRNGEKTIQQILEPHETHNSLYEKPESKRHTFGWRIKHVSNVTWILSRRLLVKARRDVFAYILRIFMYLALAILMGTVWLRLNHNQDNISSYVSALFFSGAFMSFMAVAYIPVYIEDYMNFKKEARNNLYGPLPFMISNFLVGLPFLFVITVVFSAFAYWMVNLKNTAEGFFRFILWLFLDLLAAESMVVLISSSIPIFIVALALTAFANGLWMAVQGFLVPATILNPFWYYTFYWIDYQRYVFHGMMITEFKDSIYNCDADCNCAYVSDLASECKIRGEAVLHSVGISDHSASKVGQWVGIMIVIIFVYRVLGYFALKYHVK
ncbi:uncharacterized protein SAPINGB_P005210 [Magnusiomyces paraingens]|uniref:ABC transporter domain-containing protein n=1 Tax=Magnusiomyces paraingens TaxID=2606893 RepID=A0A5E8C4D2_9ASCO|nr:uncharacterized protein SAPINGB_P005210 [Saprochaete ingens]VVT56678.1 unnamed protein product [Saprochaete ingens]